ncbi:Hypothetical Protein SLY_0353 [Strawberry lethal yellows phytoplasma (CPA) str. NZSb11]|uniref:Uncharacterized protein n=1 Tax=Strawberry lethal yellows phytoplasma (CPA) str. NZSb11 TaxID=980422 RepID=R4S0I4_PHYAS|nr:Hypothetical Protein SLY_0353 [Strawberry lethal yellows phytoplasma (CPA) str. NZSb11]
MILLFVFFKDIKKRLTKKLILKVFLKNYPKYFNISVTIKKRVL